jgi:hypothetical protein
MKLWAVLCLLAAMAMTIVPVVNASHYEKCHKHDSQIPYAIHKLCNHPRLKVPGARTSHGSKYGNVRVKITGNCNPQHHIHSQHCLDKFFHVCAEQTSSGGIGAEQDGCKTWLIERLSGPPHKHRKGDLIHNKGG